MKLSSNSFLRFPILILVVGFFMANTAFAEKIVWVSAGDLDTTGVAWDQGFIDILEGAGYEVQTEGGTMTGELTSEQIETLESGDLIIIGRGCSSGDYNYPDSWNEIIKPMICTTAYFSRLTRWNWIGTDALIGDGNSGAPLMHVDEPSHPIFNGVTLDADNNVQILDGSVGSGHTSLAATEDWGYGELLSTVVEPYSVWIVYWPQDSEFNSSSIYYAANDRLLFACGTRESTESPANPAHGWGMYNRTPEGEKMFLNAVAFMLGIVDDVDDAPATIPAEFALAQNYPNPFNPSTTINFSLSKSEQVQLQVFNLVGEHIITLINGQYQSGTHTAKWNGRDAAGNQVVSGVYLYRLQTESQTLTRKMVLIK